MRTGMLWFDPDPKTDLAAKIADAMAYYQKKYGAKPNLCFVHPTMIGMAECANGIEIKTNRAIRPNHLWLGIQIQDGGQS